MRTIIVFTLLTLQMSTFAMSFLDKEHSEKLKREAHTQPSTAVISSPDSLTPLQLFASPIQPGGKYGLGLNILNLARAVAPNSKLVKKLDKGRSLIERYADMMVACDEDIRAMVNDDRPHESKAAKKKWQEDLKALKEAKRLKYLDEGASMAATW